MNTPDTPEQNDAMSLLERRLAEIAARKQQEPESAAPTQPENPAPAAPAPAPVAATPAPAAAPVAETPAPEPVAETAAAEANSEAAMPVEVSTPAAEPATVAEASAVTAENLTSAEAEPMAAEPVAESVPTPEPVLPEPVMDESAAPVAEVAPAAPAAEAAPTSEEVPTPQIEGAAAGAVNTDDGNDEDDSEGDDEAAAPVEFDNFDSLDATQMGKLILAAIQRPEAMDQAKALIERKRQYEARYDLEREEALKRFVAAGGDPAAFDRGDTADHKALERGWQQFRERRAQSRRQEEQQQLQNLTRKRELLVQLRELAESADTNTEAAAPKVKALQTAWRAVGPVPYKESKELWQTYDALLDRFYSQHNVTFELKDLDRRKNLELKNALVARAESLAQLAETNPGQAVKELRSLHEQWKHIGPVPQDLREEVWNRFTTASDRVHGRRSEELADRRATEQQALEKKQALMTQLEGIAAYHSERIEDWRAKTDELQTLKQQWDAAGLVPRLQAQDLNKRFWVLYKKFFQSKSAFFKALDEERTNNVKRKEELIALAEQHQNDPDYAATREKYIQWQKEWKNIGHVPERLSQKLWNRFRTACNAFFERPNREVEQRQAFAAAKEAELNVLSAEKNTYLDQLAERLSQPTAGKIGTLEEYRELLAAWAKFDTERGADKVPVAPRVEERFFGLLGKYLDTVPDLSYSQKQDLLFRQQLEQMKSAPDAPQRFARREQDLRQTINALENDIATLRTNLGFFARSKNADALRAEYEGRIQEAESRLEHAKQQLKTLRQVAPPLPPREPRFGDRDRDDRRGGGRPGGGFGGGGFGGGRR